MCLILCGRAALAAELQHSGATGGTKPDAAHCGVQILHPT